MRYDPSKVDGLAKYQCIVCNRPVRNDKKRVEEHANGRKHIHNMKIRGNLCYKTFELVATFIKENFNLQLCMYTKENIHMLVVALRSINVCKDSIISVGFASENGYIRCLCLVCNGICMSIDRTMLENPHIMNEVVLLKEVFEGACIVGSRDMWELLLILYHRYGIRCQNVADLYQRSIDHAGVDIPRCNSKLHRQVAIDAAESYELLQSVELKLLNVSKTPARVLRHLCSQNLHMYAAYREVRKKLVEVQWLGTKVNQGRTVCKIKSANYESRVRNKSLLRLYIGDSMITGQCKKKVSGKVADIILDTPLPNGGIKKITLNRRAEMLMCRVLLGNYVRSIGSMGFMPNCYTLHFYSLKTLGMRKERENVFKKTLVRPPKMNNEQYLAMVRSFYPVSMIHGPPGTGKTRTLCAIVLDAFNRKQGVLCLGWTNVCVRKLCNL